MELLVFDLDGTLLDESSRISGFTRETLQLLTKRGIAYTVATGRNLHSAQEIIHDHGFSLPHVYTNGVIIWDPQLESLSLANFLTVTEAEHVLAAAAKADLTPFVHAITADHQHYICHPPVRHAVEDKLLAVFTARTATPVRPLSQLPADAQITNINMLGDADAIESVEVSLITEAHLVAYSGPAIENKALRWIDIHHSNASKGSAVTLLREQLGVSKVVCFGDSDNDLSMFAVADECYAPDNAKAAVKAAASAVIGHHNQDGIARFLRERFSL